MSTALRTRFPDLENIRERFDRLFADLSAWPVGGVESKGMPIDIQETDETVFVKATMPGIKPADLVVEIRNGLLTISGESHEEREETTGTWHVQERKVGSISRSTTLPVVVDESSGTATLEEGVLTVTFRKTHEAPAKRIAVQPS